MIMSKSYLLVNHFPSAYRVLRSVRSTQLDFRRVVSTSNITLEQKKQELELRQMEAAIRAQEEETRAKQLANEKAELELIKERRRMQEEATD